MDQLFKFALLIYLFAASILVVLYSFSDQASGVVLDVTAHNTDCGRRNIPYECTEYRAQVRYEVDGRTHVTGAPAGSKAGHGHSTSYSDRSKGEHVTVFFTDDHIDRGYVVPAAWPWIGLCMLLSPILVIVGFLAIPRPDLTEEYPQVARRRTTPPPVSLDEDTL